MDLELDEIGKKNKSCYHIKFIILGCWKKQKWRDGPENMNDQGKGSRERKSACSSY